MLEICPETVAFGLTVNSCGVAVAVGAALVDVASGVPNGVAGGGTAGVGAEFINPVGGGGTIGTPGAAPPGAVTGGGIGGAMDGALTPGVTLPLI